MPHLNLKSALRDQSNHVSALLRRPRFIKVKYIAQGQAAPKGGVKTQSPSLHSNILLTTTSWGYELLTKVLIKLSSVSLLHPIKATAKYIWMGWGFQGKKMSATKRA